MVGHGFHPGLDHMYSLLKWFPLHDGPQTILSNRLDIKPFKEEILYIMKVEKFTQPIYHQAIQTFPTNIDPSLDPPPHLSQIGDEVEKSFAGILKKSLEVFTMNDDANIGCMVQDLKVLHCNFNFFSTPTLTLPRRGGGVGGGPLGKVFEIYLPAVGRLV
jgi:hypothetical protein